MYTKFLEGQKEDLSISGHHVSIDIFNSAPLGSYSDGKYMHMNYEATYTGADKDAIYFDIVFVARDDNNLKRVLILKGTFFMKKQSQINMPQDFVKFAQFVYEYIAKYLLQEQRDFKIPAFHITEGHFEQAFVNG